MDSGHGASCFEFGWKNRAALRYTLLKKRGKTTIWLFKLASEIDKDEERAVMRTLRALAPHVDQGKFCAVMSIIFSLVQRKLSCRL